MRKMKPAAMAAWRRLLSTSSVSESSPGAAKSIADWIRYRQWDILDPVLPHLTSPVITGALLDLHPSPELIPPFIDRLGIHRLDIHSLSTAASLLATLHPPTPALHLLNQAIASSPFDHTHQLFDQMLASASPQPKHKLVLFNLLLQASAHSGNPLDALHLFSLIKHDGIIPKIKSCNTLLAALLKHNHTDKAWLFYAQMLRHRIVSTPNTFNILIKLFCKEGNIQKAKTLVEFTNKYDSRVSPQPLSATSPPPESPKLLIQPNPIASAQFDHTLQLFDKMLAAHQPKPRFNLLLQDTANSGNTHEAIQLFYLMKDAGIRPKTKACNALLRALLKHNQTDKARVLYAQMLRLRIRSTLVTFDIMINVLCKEGKINKAKTLVKFAEDSGIGLTTKTLDTVNESYCSAISEALADMAWKMGGNWAARGYLGWKYIIIFAFFIDGKFSEFDDYLIAIQSLADDSLIGRFLGWKDYEKKVLELFQEMSSTTTPTKASYIWLISNLLSLGRRARADMFKEMMDMGLRPCREMYHALIEANGTIGKLNEKTYNKRRSNGRQRRGDIDEEPRRCLNLVRRMCNNGGRDHMRQLLFDMVTNKIGCTFKIGTRERRRQYFKVTHSNKLNIQSHLEFFAWLHKQHATNEIFF